MTSSLETSIKEAKARLMKEINESLEGCLKGRARELVENNAYTKALNLIIDIEAEFEKAKKEMKS